MELNVRAFATAAGTVAAILSVLCAFFVVIAPDAAKAFFGSITHLDLTSLPYRLTWGSFVGSLVCWFAGAALVFGAGAWLYNRFSNRSAN